MKPLLKGTLAALPKGKKIELHKAIQETAKALKPTPKEMGGATGVGLLKQKLAMRKQADAKDLGNEEGFYQYGKKKCEHLDEFLAELKKGILVEHEHSDLRPPKEQMKPKVFYTRIALAHLNEDPDYYKKLAKMEKKGMLKELLKEAKEQSHVGRNIGIGAGALGLVGAGVLGGHLWGSSSAPEAADAEEAVEKYKERSARARKAAKVRAAAKAKAAKAAVTKAPTIGETAVNVIKGVAKVAK
jgi:hypothetical protein